MAKPTLFWTLKPHWRSGGFEIMRVTTEKPRRYYGTTVDGENTHVKSADCKGRFPTQEAAEAVIHKVKRVKELHAENHAILTAARNRAERLEREAIDAVLAGNQPAPPLAPQEIVRICAAAGADQCRKMVRFGNG